jgi:hypothetical protein
MCITPREEKPSQTVPFFLFMSNMKNRTPAQFVAGISEEGHPPDSIFDFVWGLRPWPGPNRTRTRGSANNFKFASGRAAASPMKVPLYGIPTGSILT